MQGTVEMVWKTCVALNCIIKPLKLKINDQHYQIKKSQGEKETHIKLKEKFRIRKG